MVKISFKIDSVHDIEEAIQILKAIKKVKSPNEPPTTLGDDDGGAPHPPTPPPPPKG